MIYDATKPILFRDGDFVLVTPDATLGVIEVKTRVKRSDLEGVLNKIDQIAKLQRKHSATASPFFGLYSYEDTEFDHSFYLQTLQNVFKGFAVTPLQILSSGESNFIRFWERDPHDQRKPIYKWHAYNISEKAPAYFLHNAIAFTCQQSVRENDDLWFPREGKEVHFIESIEMDQEK